MPGSDAWPMAIFRPGADPLESLVTALTDIASLNPSDALRLRDDLMTRESLLHLTIRMALRDAPPDRRAVILVDQFEEVFTLCQNETLRRGLIDNLIYAATLADGKTIVVLTLRADFYGKCADYPGLAAALSDHQLLVGGMTPEELRLAIERPAQLAGGEFEPGLVDVLLKDMRDQPGGLPLLQFALLELWRQRAGRRLTQAAYTAIGGVEGALEKRAETVFQQFSEAEQHLCRQIFLRLTQSGEGVEATKRRVVMVELLPAKGDPTKIEAVVQRLSVADARLITIEGKGADAGERVIEVAHEALIRGWKRLKGWLNEDREFLLWRQRLHTSVEEWKRINHDESVLLRGGLLAEAERWFEARPDDLSAEEQQFIQASAELRQRERAARERTRRRNLTALTTGLLMAIALSVVAGFFWYTSEKHLRQSKINEIEALTQSAQALFLAHDEIGGLLAGVRAGMQARQVTLEDRLRYPLIGNMQDLVDQIHEANRLARPGNSEEYFAFSPDNQRIASGGHDGTIKLWAVDGREILTFQGRHADDVLSVAFSPDGKLLASGSSDKTIKLWTVADGKELDTLAGHTESVWSVAFSPDGQLLASGSSDKTIKLWSMPAGKELRTLSEKTGSLHSIAFSPDGTFLAAGGDNGVTLWQVAEGKAIWSAARYQNTVWEVALSPDGKLLAAGCFDGKIELWTVPEGQLLKTLIGHPKSVWGLAFNPDGKVLVSGDESGAIKRWTLPDGRELSPLQEHKEPVRQLAFSPDGALLAASHARTGITLWAMADNTALRTWPADAKIDSVAFSPDGTRLAAGGGTEITLRSVADGRELLTLEWAVELEEMQALLQSGVMNTLRVAFSPTGNLLAAAKGKTIKLWNPTDGRRLSTLQGHAGNVTSLAFSPDGKLLASGSEDKTLKLWTMPDGKVWRTISGFTDSMFGAIFDPTGTRLAAGSGDGAIRLWDAADGRELLRIQAGVSLFQNVAFSPDGTLLAAGSSHFVKFWSVADGREIRSLPGEPGSVVGSVAFSPDRKLLVAGDLSGTLTFWSVAEGQRIRVIREFTSPVDSVAFSPDGKFLAAASSSDPTIKLWELDLDNVLVRNCEWLQGYLMHHPQVTPADWQQCLDLQLAAYRQQTTHTPTHADAWNQLGRVLEARDKLADAITAYQTQVAVKPDHATAWYSLGLALEKHGHLPEAGKAFEKYAELVQARDHPEAAIAAYHKLLALQPDHPAAWYKLGLVFRMHGKLDEAIIAFRKQADLHPTDPEIWYQLGLASQQHGNDAEALAAFQRQLTLTPDHLQAIQAIKTLQAQSLLADAINKYRQQIAAQPDHPEIWDKLGQALEKQGKMAEALAAYQKQVAAKPDHATAWYRLGSILSRQRKFKEAVAAYQRQLEVNPQHPDAYLMRGFILDEQGKLPEALAAFQTQIELNPQHARAWCAMGRVLTEQDKWAEGLAACQKQVEIKPDHEAAWNSIGWMLYAMSKGPISANQPKLNEALAAFQKQVEITPDHRTAWEGMGRVLKEQGKWDQALAAYRKQVEVAPDHDNAWWQMGSVFQEQKKWDDAIAAFQQQVAVKPDHEVAWGSLENALMRRGRIEEGLAVGEKLLAGNPHEVVIQGFATSLRQHSKYLIEQGKWADVLAMYKKILALKPNQQQALQGLLGLSFNLFKQKKWEESITVSRALLEVKPDSDMAWLLLGAALWEQGKLPEAALAFTDGLKINPNNLDLLSNDAGLAFEQGDLVRCQARLAAALPLVKPDNEFFAILPFYQWLSNPTQGWQPILTAIQGIGPKVKFKWSFNTTKPALGRLDEKTQQIARHFIEFFEGKIDLPILQGRLAEH